MLKVIYALAEKGITLLSQHKLTTKFGIQLKFPSWLVIYEIIIIIEILTSSYLYFF